MNTPVLSVGQINTYIKSIIDGDPNLSSVFVVGEISNFTNHYRTGHFYFTLKDKDSAIKAVMFRSSAQRLRFIPENGMSVIIRGRISVFERDGQYQLYADDMQPDGIGTLNIAYEQLKSKLESQGLFDDDRKRPLPKIPERIGVITSPTGAAVRDIINVLSRRFPYSKVVFVPVQVQGPDAAPQISAALDLINKYSAADVIIVGRGGGSIEDLWAFNEECVALAVSRSTIPVVSAVGHETDFTICDFVADMRAPTPSAAAEIVVPDKKEQQFILNRLVHSLKENMFADISQKRTYIDAISQSGVLKNPLGFIDNSRQILDGLLNRLQFSQKEIIAEKSLQFASCCSKLDALNPFKVLSRGYAAVYSGCRVVGNASDIDMNSNVRIRFNDGEVICRPDSRILFEEV